MGSFNTLFHFNLTSGECPITKWTPVIGQLHKPITTRVPDFLTNQQIVTIEVSSPVTVVMVPTVMASRVVRVLITFIGNEDVKGWP